jgi:hypothetical protein
MTRPLPRALEPKMTLVTWELATSSFHVDRDMGTTAGMTATAEPRERDERNPRDWTTDQKNRLGFCLVR